MGRPDYAKFSAALTRFVVGYMLVSLGITLFILLTIVSVGMFLLAQVAGRVV